MRIAIVVRSLRIGGMERVAVNLADAFYDLGHEVDLIYLKNNKVELTPDNNVIPIHHFYLDKMLMQTGIGILLEFFARLLNGIVPKSLFVWKGLFLSPIFRYKLKQLEKDGQPFDLIIMRGQGTFELVWNHKDSRVIQVCENIFAKGNPNRLQSWYAKLLFQNKTVSCVSQPVYDNFLSYQKAAGFQVAKLAAITNPMDSDKIAQKANEPVAGIPNIPYLLGLGRFVDQKNFPLLIKAYARLIQKYAIEHQLVLVGDGRDKDKLKQLIRSLNIDDKVLMPGSTLTPYPWMRHSDLFILSSKFEGLGMVIIEAFASGTNAVTTCSPGGVQFVMDSPRLQQQMSDMTVESLADTIYRTLQSTRPEQDINRVLQRHNPALIANQFIALAKTPNLTASH